MTFKLVALLISIYFPPESGGGATGAWNRAMTLHKMGFHVFVLSGFPAYPLGKVTDQRYRRHFFKVEKDQPFTVIRIRLLPLAHEGYFKRFILFNNFVLLSLICLPRILRLTGTLCVVYARSPVLFSSLPGFIYSKITGALYIYEVPDLWPEELVAFPSNFSNLVLKIGVILASWSYSLPDVIITIGNLAADYIRTKYNPKAPVYGVPVGVDTDKFYPLSKSESRKTLIDEGVFPRELESKFIILYSGIISGAQHIEMLAFVSEKLLEIRKDNVAIVIIGEGPSKQNLQTMKAEKNLLNFYLLSLQPRSRMSAIISACDCCVVVLSSESIFQIALPTKFYEYLACRKPIIGICSGELANVIRQWGIGFVVKQEDVGNFLQIIDKLDSSSSDLETIQHNLDRAAQAFSLEEMCQRFKLILREINFSI